MKQLFYKLAIPLTLLSFVLIQKWWNIIPVDAPESTMVGFPLPYACDGWFTSGAIQFFILELIVDLLLYLFFWSAMLYMLDRYFIKIKTPKALAILLVVIESIIVFGFILFACMPETQFKSKRNFDYKVVKTGVHCIFY